MDPEKNRLLEIQVWEYLDFKIPEHMHEALMRYIEYGIPGGSFLAAVLCNDLMGACSHADDLNLRNLPAYTSYLYNCAPAGSYRSLESYNRWIELKGLRGYILKHQKMAEGEINEQ